MCNISILSIQRLAGYPETPYEDIFYLSYHENPIVRTAVAARAGMEADETAHILYRLALDPEVGVRMAVINRGIVPVDIVWMMAADKDLGIKALALKRLGRTEQYE